MEILSMVMQLMLSNSPFVLDAVLLAIIGVMVWERIRFQKILIRHTEMITEYRDKYDEDIKDVITKYYDSNMTLIKAMDEIRVVLDTILKTNNR